MIPNRIHRTLHAPALPHGENSERGIDCKQKSRDASRASSATRRKQREGRQYQTEFAGRSTRQRCHVPKTARGSAIPSRIHRPLHAPALPRAQNSERGMDSRCRHHEKLCNPPLSFIAISRHDRLNVNLREVGRHDTKRTDIMSKPLLFSLREVERHDTLDARYGHMLKPPPCSPCDKS